MRAENGPLGPGAGGDGSRRVRRAAGSLPPSSRPAFDDLTRTACRVANAPMAMLSLLDGPDQLILSVVGLTAPVGVTASWPAAEWPCRHVVAGAAPIAVADVRTNPRLRDLPALTTHHVAAYAGVPLCTDDPHVAGTLCVLDAEPRQWGPDTVAALEDLARIASADVALLLDYADLQSTTTWMTNLLDTAHDAFISIDSGGAVTAWNAAAQTLFGWSAGEALGRQVADLIIPQRLRKGHEQGLARVRQTGASALAGQRLELSAHDRSGREFPVELILQLDRGTDDVAIHAFLHDISIRKAAEQSLEHERTFLRTLLDSLDTGVAACDSDGRLVLFNRALRELHGIDEGLLGAPHWNNSFHLYGADGRTLLTSAQLPLARAFAGEYIDGEQVVIRPPGVAPRRCLANARPIDAGDGRRLGAVVAVHDITDQHRAEILRNAQHAVARALAEAGSAEQAVTAVVAAVAEALGWTCGEYWRVDPEQDALVRVAAWSAAGSDLSVFLDAQWSTLPRGQGLPGIVWETSREQWIRDLASDTGNLVRRHAAQDAGLHAAIGLPVRSGTAIIGVLAFFAETVEEPDEQLLDMLDGICAYVGQHVERRRAEELTLALAAARRDFDRVIQHINDYVWTIEISPDGTVRSIYASPNARDVVGAAFPTDDDLAEVMRQRVHPHDLAAFATFEAILAAGDPADIECRIVGYDNITRWIWIRAVARRDGDRLFVDGISTNVTERRELAERRERLLADEQQQVHRLRELDRMKDDLVALVSHELRNPIATIRSHLELLLDDEHLTDEHRDVSTVIDRNSARLERLVDDLLDLARLDSGHLVLDTRPVSLTHLVRQTIDDHHGTARAKNLTVTTELPSHLPVDADPLRLRQILDNLVSNAIKYTPDGGTITVTGHHDGTTCTVFITDTGIGVPADEYPKLFQRFFRASTATQRGIKGTGLGLAITQAIVEAHGGTITAKPGPVGGTVVTVTLPAPYPSETTDQEERRACGEGRR